MHAAFQAQRRLKHAKQVRRRRPWIDQDGKTLVWAKLILGRLCDAVLPDFSRFPAGSDDYLNAFFTDLCHMRYCGRHVPGA